MGSERLERRHPGVDLEWRLRARCRGLPTEIFFASDGERGSRRAVYEERAKEFCRCCAVRSECLNYALSSFESFGIWGATTPRERRSRAAQ